MGVRLAGTVLLVLVAPCLNSQASAEDVKIAEKAVKKVLPVVRKPGVPGLVPLTAAPLSRSFPEWRFLTLIFRQYPVPRIPPEPLSSQNVFAAYKGGLIFHFNACKCLEAFFPMLAPVTNDKSAKEDVEAWLLLSQQFRQDGFFKFAIPKDSLAVERLKRGWSAKGKAVVVQGGKSEIHATLTFDEAGKLVRIAEKSSVKAGFRPMCQAIKLLDADPVVRHTAEKDMLVMGQASPFFVCQKKEYHKRAPFSVIRWEGNEPVVKIAKSWYTLVTFDRIAAGDIVAWSRHTYKNLWQKSLAEVLVGVLTRMGHEPRDTIHLAVRPLASSTALLTELITGLRKEKKLVGLAAMVMVDGQVMASAADGERKKNSGVRIEVGDSWHLGSITKSITATMIGRLVESGRMKWTDTIGERFPDASIHKDWKPVTLLQLLTHTSGAPENFSFLVMLKQPALGRECTRARQKAVMDVIARKPAHPPGKQYAYSSVGYTVAAAMAETATGVTWEDLVKREVFEPLKLADAGFGPPKSPSKTLDQPRGHHVVLGWKISADDDADNTPIVGPAGAVHMTLDNLCKYAMEHLRGELGASKLLAAETYKRLHTPAIHNYACGWVVKQPTNEIPYMVYWHNGSNTMWYALVVFIPGKNMVVAVTSNDGDIKQAESAAWKVVNACANQFNVKGDASGRKSLVAPEKSIRKKRRDE